MRGANVPAVTALLGLLSGSVGAVDLSGELTVTSRALAGGSPTRDLTTRYLPVAQGERTFGRWTADFEAAANLSGVLRESGGTRTEDTDATLHRLWLRWYGADTEFRAGRQKLSFGPARVLRALQWFDSLDPTDPTAFTIGADALLLRRYLPGQQALWLWRTEAVPNGADAGWGGRYLRPVGSAELGLAVHAGDSADRAGLEAFWDPSVGLWSELGWQRSHTTGGVTSELVVGVDYTFPWGNGIYGLLEAKAVRADHPGLDAELLAGQLSWPLGLMDNLVWIALTGDTAATGSVTSHFVEWRRTLDRHLLSVGLTLSPDGAGEPAPGMRLVYSFSH